MVEVQLGESAMFGVGVGFGCTRHPRTDSRSTGTLLWFGSAVRCELVVDAVGGGGDSSESESESESGWGMSGGGSSLSSSSESDSESEGSCYVRTTELVFSVLELVGRDGPCAAVAFFSVVQVLCACRGGRGC